MSNETYYVYGMRLRPCGIGCQPKDFIDHKDDPEPPYSRYWSLLKYNRKLTDQERFVYSLDLLEIQTAETDC